MSGPSTARLLNVVSSFLSKLKNICTLYSPKTVIRFVKLSIVFFSGFSSFCFPLNLSLIFFSFLFISRSTFGYIPNHIVFSKSFFALTVLRNAFNLSLFPVLTSISDLIFVTSNFGFIKESFVLYCSKNIFTPKSFSINGFAILMKFSCASL